MDWELDLLSEAVQWMVWWVDGNFPERYFSTIYQFFCCPSELLLCAREAQQRDYCKGFRARFIFYMSWEKMLHGICAECEL